MKGNHQARPPQPVMSEREKRLIKTLYEDGAFVNISYSTVAQWCCIAYPEDNLKQRDRSGIAKFVAKIRD